MLNGKLTRLRRLETADAGRIMEYWNNYELRQYLASPLPSTEEDIVEMIKSKNEAFRRRSEFYFGIELIQENALIGFCNLESVSWISRHAFIGVFCLFSPEFRGKGYSKDAMLTLLDYAFSMLDLHAVVLWVETFNTRAISFYEKFGFKHAGVMRELAFRNGKRADVAAMDILQREFRDKYGILPKGDVF